MGPGTAGEQGRGKEKWILIRENFECLENETLVRMEYIGRVGSGELSLFLSLFWLAFTKKSFTIWFLLILRAVEVHLMVQRITSAFCLPEEMAVASTEALL